MSNTERTFIMIKPDGVHRGLLGDIIKRFEQKGFKLVAMKFMQVSHSHSHGPEYPCIYVVLFNDLVLG